MLWGIPQTPPLRVVGVIALEKQLDIIHGSRGQGDSCEEPLRCPLSRGREGGNCCGESPRHPW